MDWAKTTAKLGPIQVAAKRRKTRKKTNPPHSHRPSGKHPRNDSQQRLPVLSLIFHLGDRQTGGTTKYTKTQNRPRQSTRESTPINATNPELQTPNSTGGPRAPRAAYSATAHKESSNRGAITGAGKGVGGFGKNPAGGDKVIRVLIGVHRNLAMMLIVAVE